MLELVTEPKQTAKHSPHVAQPLDAASNPSALLKISTAAALAGIGTSTLYLKARTDPTFPKLVKMGKRCTRLQAGPYMAWLKAQAA